MLKTKASHLVRYKLIIQYDGTNYSGWQKQGEKSIRTIQGTLLNTAALLFETDNIDVQGNGRTDAGVHALNYTAHLETDLDYSPNIIKAGLNEKLPRDIVILDVEKTDNRFHARHHCLGRSYIYRIGMRKNAFNKRYVWWVKEDLDLDVMAKAADLLTGMHDFAAFAEKKERKKSTKVLVQSLKLVEDEEGLQVQIVASHFLWHLVRRLVALLVEVGGGRMPLDQVKKMLDGQMGKSVRLLAPAHALFFERAFYDKNELEEYVNRS